MGTAPDILNEMPEESRESASGLVFAAGIMLGLFFCGAVLTRDPTFDMFFGVEAYRTPGPAVLLLAFGLLLAVLLVPGLAPGLANRLGRVVAFIPRRLRLPLLLIACGAAFWIFRSHKLSGDALYVSLTAIHGDVFASNPLTGFLYIALGRSLSWPVVESIRLVSSACGVLYVFSAVGVARECLPAGPARSGLAAILITCGTSALYFGSIEVYAPLAAAIGLYFFLGIRALKRGGGGPWPAVVLGTAFGLHGSAGFLLPSLGYLANGCRLWPIRPGRVMRAGLAFLVPVILVYGALFLFTWGGELPEGNRERFGSFLGGDTLGPFLPIRLTAGNVLHRYALLDAEHLVGVLNLMVLAAPAGFLLLLLGRWPMKQSAAFRFVAVAALFLVLFPFYWKVGFCHRMDWDLFSLMGIPVAFLGGLAFLSRGGGSRRAVGAAVLSLFCFVPFVLSNWGDTHDRRIYMTNLYWAMRNAQTGGSTEVSEQKEVLRRAEEKYGALMARYDPDNVAVRTERARRLADSGQIWMAETLLRKILESEPGNVPASEVMGSLLMARGEAEEARFHLLNAVREWEWSLGSWMNLARIALAGKDEDEAISLLENGLRRGGLHPLAGRALFLLAKLRAGRGEVETARVLYALAAERGVTRLGGDKGNRPGGR